MRIEEMPIPGPHSLPTPQLGDGLVWVVALALLAFLCFIAYFVVEKAHERTTQNDTSRAAQLLRAKRMLPVAAGVLAVASVVVGTVFQLRNW